MVKDALQASDGGGDGQGVSVLGAHAGSKGVVGGGDVVSVGVVDSGAR